VLDITFENDLEPRKGRVLISDPFVGDEYFERSVVYLCEHSKEGSFGFILNKYVEIDINELNPDFPDIKTRLSLGGPVETESLYFLHTLGNELNESIELKDGIFIGGDFDQLTTVIKDSHFENNQIRFFLGYSGWDPEQLKYEIEDNVWVVAEVDNIDEIMNSYIEDPWTYFISKLGKKFELYKTFPINPSDN
jgi:putative transcriptional regulator